MSTSAHSSVDRLLDPIAATAPAGRDARDEPEHEIVRAEVAKLSSLAGEQIDWQRVETAASALLANKSKDLTIASYLAYALQERHALVGLDHGLTLLTGLIENFGQQLFPLRERARANALDWYVEHATNRLQTALASPPEVADLRGKLQALGAALRSLFGEECPSVDRLRVALDRMALSAAAEAPAAGAVDDTDNVASSQASQRGGYAGRDASALSASVWWLPISDASPAGSDATYSEGANLARQELAKLETLTSDKPDWRRVYDECDRLLRTETKDLVVVTQLTQALHALHGLEGLTLGLTATAGLLDDYWDSMWPPISRLRRRANALSSLAERLSLSLASAPASSSDVLALDSVEEALTRLTSTVALRFGADVPDLSPLQSALQGLRRASLQATPPSAVVSSPQAVTQAPPFEGATDASRGPTEPVPVASLASTEASEIAGFLDGTGRALLQAASVLRDVDSNSALACRLLRIGAWLDIEALPSADPQGTTRIAPPDRRAQQALADYVGAERWEAVLAQAEGMFPDDVFWLDLQYYAARAHTQLGGTHATLALLVHSHTQELTRRLPGLLQLHFSDGSPMASSQTRAWLEPAPPVVSHAAASNEGAVGEHALPPSVREAVLRGDKGATPDLDLLLKAASVRASFCIRLELSAAFVARGSLEAGIALLCGLEQELDVYQLERWEPELAQRVLRELWSALQRQQATNGVVHPEAGRVCARLARLLPSALL